MKLLLDTNVLIAAFISHGVCADLLEHCITRHKCITSSFILDEFQKHLSKKFQYPQSQIEQAVRLLESEMILVDPQRLMKFVCRDRDDDMILATAVTGKCKCLITGDRDLLVLKEYEGIVILSPAEFWRYEAGA